MRELHDAKRKELVTFLDPWRENALDGHPCAGGRRLSRRKGKRIASRDGQPLESGKDLSVEPLRPELVVQVAYDHMQGDRFRHTARSAAGAPTSALTMHLRQLEVVPPHELAEIFARRA